MQQITLNIDNPTIETMLYNLSKAQSKALDFTNTHNTSLLFANTGSGKTEIYIKAIEEQVNNNKQAILLMPEISLTPQMQKRLEIIIEWVCKENYVNVLWLWFEEDHVHLLLSFRRKEICPN